jgi:D-inositol-3-phosphate glycosyltransferase
MHEDLSGPLRWRRGPDPEGDHAHALPALELARDRVERVALLAMQSSPAPLPGAEPAGGTSVYVASVAAALARVGVACDIYARATSPDQPLLRELGPGVRLLSVPAGPRVPLDRTRLVSLVAAFAAGVAELGEELGPYQVLSTHWWLSGLAGLRLRERWAVPVEFRPHSLALERNAALARGHLVRSPERARGEARVIARADLLVAGSGSEHADLTGRYGAAADSVRLVPCGVDPELFRPGDRQRARDRLGVDLQGRQLLLYVGRLDSVKGVDLAVDALVALRGGWPGLDVELLVVGGSPDPLRYRRQVGELRNKVNWHAAAGRVHFLPARPHQSLPPLYQAADLLLMPSRAETFGLVALEAQACGVPVVASRVGSLPEVVSHGITGVLVAQRDPRTWARAAAALLSSPARLHAMRAAAAAHATRFPWHATATGLLAAYHETLARFTRPGSARRAGGGGWPAGSA